MNEKYINIMSNENSKSEVSNSKVTKEKLNTDIGESSFMLSAGNRSGFERDRGLDRDKTPVTTCNKEVQSLKANHNIHIIQQSSFMNCRNESPMSQMTGDTPLTSSIIRKPKLEKKISVNEKMMLREVQRTMEPFMI
jgi:hypothetical protein